MNSEEFEVNNPFASLNSGERRTFVWRVYDSYNFKWYMSADEDADVIREYEPFLDEPALFLKFADLPSLDDRAVIELEDALEQEKALHDWIYDYGLLGLTPSDEAYRVPGSNKRIAERPQTSDPWAYANSYDDRGGPEETDKIFTLEQSNANHTLNLYKAALSKDVKELEKLLDFEGTAEEVPEWGEFIDRYFLERRHESRVDLLINIATRFVEMAVNRVLEKHTYPSLSFDLSEPLAEQEKLRNPQSLTASLWPRNLLGAMYLQFYWIITSSSNPSYCKYCQKPISYAPTMPGSGKRKTYKNKRFCNKQCRQNYNYHHHRKTGRQDP